MEKHTQITCPHCGKPLDVEDILASGIEKQMEIKFEQKLEIEKGKLEYTFKSKVEQEYAEKMKMLETELSEKSAKIQDLNKKELELLRSQKELKEKQQEFELAVERQLTEKQKEIEEKIRKAEDEKTDMKMREKDKTIEDLRKLVDEMKRKSEQGSMQTQGEVQELALEEMLSISFPFDTITEVVKGQKGADALQSVRNQYGQECGKIIYESKNTKNWSKDWIEKLKADMLAAQADIAVLITAVMPKDMDHFGLKDGIWICHYHEVKGLIIALRDGLIKVHHAVTSQENKEDKMQMLYSYLTGSEFRQQMEAIVDGFTSMRDSITRERAAMEKLWKEREKQLDKVLLSASGFYGSVKGIAGSSIPEIKLLFEDDSKISS